MFSPSLMCMDFLDIRHQLEVLNTRCDFYHVDIMDGHFVKNITLSPCIVQAFSKAAKKPMDCHLMVTNPTDYIQPLAKAGAEFICPHVETINTDAFRTIAAIRAAGCRPGLVFNPATPVETAEYFLHLVDKITVMTVDPGFAGQKFISEMLGKIETLRELKEKNGYGYIIEVDGSCNRNTFGELYSAGTECFIVGTSGLFSLDESLENAWDIMLGQFEEAIM